MAGCVTIYNPATQRNETLLIDTASEVKLGAQMDQQLQKEIKWEKDPLMVQRLTAIGKKIAAGSDRNDITYQFRVVKDKEFNAFAIPGGYVYVNSGLLEATNEDELACVLAHEIGHIAARHSVKRLQAVLGYQLILGIIFKTGEADSVGQALDVVFNLVNLGYSRQDEYLADKLGVRYARRAGFNPFGMVTFFEKLQKEAQKKGTGFNLVFLSSHPPIEERIKQVKAEISSATEIAPTL
ncbi:MAG: M48 family metalloprotease [Candidatus Omnitrophica bacterium]|nr:M48 family metalloprotease [Candidatus Omnitrophota bacterium]